MKKKLIGLFIFGYVGGSFSIEPLSPFGPNPFASLPEKNPFQPREEPARPGGFVPPTPPSLPNEKNNPFMPHEQLPEGQGVPRETHQGFGGFEQPAPFEQHPMQEGYRPEQNRFNEGVQQGYRPEENNHFNQQHSDSFHQKNSLSEVDTEKNPDTGEAAVVDSEVDTFEQEGSGNWLLKRVWWEKTEGVYEQIKEVFNEIMSARMDYIAQRNRLDRELDISYGQIGLEEGELQDIIDHCLDFVKKEKPEQGFLNKQQEDLYNALQHKQHDLEQIKLDLKALQAIDQKIDEALDTLFKQIDVANQYEQKAWENFKDIARELNDKIARKSYYETEGLLKDIQSIHLYITSQFSSYFNQTLQTARTHSQSISSQVQVLKQASVDLKKEAAALEQAQEAERLKKELSEHDKEFEAAEKKKEIKKNSKAVPATGIISNFIDSAKMFVLHVVDRILHSASSLVSRVKDWFGKEESVVKGREKTLKLKVEDEKKKIESVVSKEIMQDESSLEHELAIKDHDEHDSMTEIDHVTLKGNNHEGHLIESNHKEDSLPIHSSVTSEENPFKSEHQAESFAHPVSVMPQDKLHTVSTNPFDEQKNNHPAFSHDAVHYEEQGHAVSPFVK